MCKFASLVLTEDRELWIPRDADLSNPALKGSTFKREHHSLILQYHGISEIAVDNDRSTDIVRCEISPHTAECFEDYRQWTLRWDQDRFPDWFVEEVDRDRAYRALERRAAEGFYLVDLCNNPFVKSLSLRGAVFVHLFHNVELTHVNLPDTQRLYAYDNSELRYISVPSASHVEVYGSPASVEINHHPDAVVDVRPIRL